MRRPKPHIGYDDGAFWEYCRRQELRVPRCRACGRDIWPILPVCPHDLSDDLEWVQMPDRGIISSWIVYHRAFDREFRDVLPYVCANVELTAGVRMTGNVFGSGREIRADCFIGEFPRVDALNGREVRLFFETCDDDLVIPQWELTGSQSRAEGAKIENETQQGR